MRGKSWSPACGPPADRVAPELFAESPGPPTFFTRIHRDQPSSRYYSSSPRFTSQVTQELERDRKGKHRGRRRSSAYLSARTRARCSRLAVLYLVRGAACACIRAPASARGRISARARISARRIAAAACSCRRAIPIRLFHIRTVAFCPHRAAARLQALRRRRAPP